MLTVDPTFQYVKANGGSSAILGQEGTAAGGQLGYIGNNYYFGEDLNGDGDMLDTGYPHGVRLYAPSQTVTHRYTLTSSLRWDIAEGQSFRLSYAHDYGRHRQTGQVGYLLNNGQAKDPFPINDPITAGNGAVVQKRDRKSFAILDQVSAEYRGEFFDDALVFNVGGRLPFFKRELHQNCFTTSSAGYVDCIAGDSAAQDAYAAAHPYTYTPGVNGGAPKVTGYAPPQDRTLKYHRFLPSASVTYNLASAFQVYASYSKGLQVPSTDNLYQSFYLPQGVQNPKPETTDNFDGGLRYTTSKIQAQVGPWYTIFNNRLAASYDPITDITTYRNLGTVHKYGIDGSIAYQPIPELSLYAFASYLKSKIQGDVQTGTDASGNPVYDATAGKREAGSPVYTVGGRAQLNLNPVEFGVQVKHTGKRYVNDQNLPIYSCSVRTVNDQCPATGTLTQLYPATAPEYTVVDLDARVNLGWAGLNDTTYVQFNVTNVFDSLYVGGFGGNTSTFSSPYAYIGSPRTFSATLNVQF